MEFTQSTTSLTCSACQGFQLFTIFCQGRGMCRERCAERGVQREVCSRGMEIDDDGISLLTL